jgi:hypothetical protein
MAVGLVGLVGFIQLSAISAQPSAVRIQNSEFRSKNNSFALLTPVSSLLNSQSYSMPYALCSMPSHIPHPTSLNVSLRGRDEGIGGAGTERKSEVCENAQLGYYHLVKNGGERQRNSSSPSRLCGGI